MADRTIVLAENGRHAVRGVSVVNQSEFVAYQDDDDALTYVIDLANYLDGATISSVSRLPNGATITNTSNTTTRITQRLKGFGRVEIKATLSNGDVQQLFLNVAARKTSNRKNADYVT